MGTRITGPTIGRGTTLRAIVFLGPPSSVLSPFLSIVIALLLVSSSVSAHNVVDTPDLGKLITTADLIVRGSITAGTRMKDGARVATLKVDKVLKGDTPGKEIAFQSDPDHGVRYQRGERALIFLTQRPPGSLPRYASPQIFRAKYTITSFDPTGYDRLVSGLLQIAKVKDRTARDARLKELMTKQLRSHEYDVRSYAVQVLEKLQRSQPPTTARTED